MEYQDKPSLRKAITGFLNQRKRAYKMMYKRTGDVDFVLKHAVIQHIQFHWTVCSKWDYWRNCREIILQEERILEILPSAKGKHAVIRQHVLDLIEHCREIQAIDCYEYRRTNRIETEKQDRSTNGVAPSIRDRQSL